MSGSNLQNIPFSELNLKEPEVNTSFLGTNTDKRINAKQICSKYKMRIILAVIFVLVFIVIIISLIAYSKVYVDEDEFVIVESNAEKNMYMFTGSLVIKDSCMLEPWKVNRTAFQHRIEKAYSQSPALQSYFVSAKVNNVFNGENTTAFVTLNFSLPTSKKDETKYKMSKEFVGGVLRQDIYDEEKSICQNSTVLLDPFHVILAY